MVRPYHAFEFFTRSHLS